MLFWFWTIVIILLGAAAASILLANLSLAPWVPTKRKDLERIFQVADLKEGELFCDFGSGTGTTVFAATKYSKANGLGIELSFPVYFYAQVKKVFTKNKRVRFVQQNIYKADLSEVDVLYVFGMPDKLGKVVEKLKREAPKGMRLISYVFEIKELEFEKKDKPTEDDLPIYLYRF